MQLGLNQIKRYILHIMPIYIGNNGLHMLLLGGTKYLLGFKRLLAELIDEYEKIEQQCLKS
ncbi:hypothetical protein D3C78_907700 [compost metagenome]